MTDPLRLAIVGLGRMGAFHARTLRSVPEIELTAAVDPADHAVDLAAELGIETVVPTVEDLRESASADAWLIAAPTHLHPPLVEAAAAAGVPVLCEKPLSLDVATGLRLGEAVGDAQVQIGFWRRFSPPWVGARELLRSGHVGRPVLLRLAQWDADPPPPSFCNPRVSGGLAVDCGIHEFDLVEWMTGARVTEVLAVVAPNVDPDVEAVGDVDNLLIVTRLSTGAVATIDLSRNARFGDDVRTEVLGSDGALFVDFLPAGALRVGTAEGLTEQASWAAADPMAAGVAAQAQAFAANVAGAGIEVPEIADANRALTLALAARESIRTGEWVVVD